MICTPCMQEGPMPSTDDRLESNSLLGASRVVISVGTVGHPFACSGPCENVVKGVLCEQGEKCQRCHLCCVSPSDAPAKMGCEQVAPTNVSKELATSVGTKGHPHSCKAPCKYFRRKTGCRDGLDCQSCHRCFWQRQKKESQPSELKDVVHSAAITDVRTTVPAQMPLKVHISDGLATWQKLMPSVV